MRDQLIEDLERHEFDTQRTNIDAVLEREIVWDLLNTLDEHCGDPDTTVSDEEFDLAREYLHAVLEECPPDPEQLDQIITLTDGTQVNLFVSKPFGNWYARFLDPYDQEHNCEYVFYTFKEIVAMLNETFSE